MTNKEYMKQFGTGMAAYVATVVASAYYLNNNAVGTALTIMLAVSPVLPAMYAMVAYIKRVRAMDEFQRRIIIESALWSMGIVGLLSFSYGFLEGAINMPKIGMIWVFPALLGLQGLVQCILNFQHKAGSGDEE